MSRPHNIFRAISFEDAIIQESEPQFKNYTAGIYYGSVIPRSHRMSDLNSFTNRTIALIYLFGSMVFVIAQYC